MTRFRPRFSIRALAIFMTLICVYFGAWEVTKRHGVRKMQTAKIYELGSADSPFPLIVRRCEAIRESEREYGYYLWLFGPTIPVSFPKWK